MKIMNFIASAGVIGILAACAQQEEPTMVRPEPMFDKYGGGSCEGDWIYVPGTVPEESTCVPPDECEPVYNSAGQVIECPPPPRRPDRDRDDSSTRDPNQSSTAPRG